MIIYLVIMLVFSACTKNVSINASDSTIFDDGAYAFKPLPLRFQAIPAALVRKIHAPMSLFSDSQAHQSMSGYTNPFMPTPGLLGAGQTAPPPPMPIISPGQGSPIPPPPVPPVDDLPGFSVYDGPIYSLCGNGRLDRVVNHIACPETTPTILFIDILNPCIGFVYIEQCDDGNTFSNDGCSSTCMKECCGNGIVEEGEECDTGLDKGPDLPNISPPADFPIDDAGNILLPLPPCANPRNVVDLGNCSRHCQLIICGDGIVNGQEQCDDGNDFACDGCFRCALEKPMVNNCCKCSPPPVN